jgi:regulator of protease activity HflC (stomatin/prohibitin superfamily)
MKSIFKIVGFGLIGLASLVVSGGGVFLFFSKNYIIPTVSSGFLFVVSVGLIIWTWKSVKIISASQIGVLLRFGEIVSICHPGLYFALIGIYKWMIYTRKQHILVYERIPVITKEGTYGGPKLSDYIAKKKAYYDKKKDVMKKGETATQKGKDELLLLKKDMEEFKADYKNEAEAYERAQLHVGIAVYFRWPDSKEGLESAVNYGPSPGDPDNPDDLKKIREHFKDAVEGNIREICGTMTWGEVVENRLVIKIEMEERLNEESSPFRVAGIDNFHTVVSSVELPVELQRLLTKPQEERLKAKAAVEEAIAMQEKISGGIGKAARDLENKYKFSKEEAIAMAFERHGDFVAGQEGELVRIKFDGGNSGGQDIAKLGFMFEQGRKIANRKSSSSGSSSDSSSGKARDVPRVAKSVMDKIR